MATFTINSEEFISASTTLSVQNSSVALLTVSTNLGSVEINWGDGVVDNNVSHTYATPYTGDIEVSILGGSLSNVTSIFSGPTGSSNFNFNLTKFLEFPNIENINITRNFISGDLSSVSSLGSLVSFGLSGNTTITGDVSNLSTLTGFVVIGGNNTVSGDVSNFNNLIGSNLNITGANTLTGDITNNINVTSTVDIKGNNTLSGSINTINNSVTNLTISSTSNTVTGALNNLPTSLSQLNIQGIGNISGNTNNISAINYSFLNITSPNTTVTGLVQDYISGRNLFIFNNSNITGGDLGLIDKSNFIAFGFDDIDGQLSYTQGLWNNGSVVNISLNVSNSIFSLTITELDQLLIDLNNSTFNKSAPQSKLVLTGGFSRGTNSDTAFNQLTADGFDITIS